MLRDFTGLHMIMITPEFQGFSRGGSEIEPHGVYILNSECTLFELRVFI